MARQSQNDEFNIDAELQAILKPLTTREDALLSEKEELQARVSEINNELNRVKRIRLAAFPELKLAAPQRKPSRTSQSISEEAMTRLKKYMQDNKEPHSIPELKTALGMSEPTVSKGIKALRDQELVRLAGKSDTNARLFAYMGDA